MLVEFHVTYFSIKAHLALRWNLSVKLTLKIWSRSPNCNQPHRSVCILILIRLMGTMYALKISDTHPFLNLRNVYPYKMSPQLNFATSFIIFEK